MPAEIVAILTGILVAAGFGVQQLIKATVNRRVKKMEEDAAEALKDRDLRRQNELEAMRQQTAKAQEDAEQAKAIGENLTNLTSAVLEMVKSHAKESHANREALTNNTQTVGDLADSVDRVGTILSENTSATRAIGLKVEDTGAKADAVVAAIEHLEQIMNSGVREIKLLLVPPPPPTNVVNVNTGKPDVGDLPLASGQ